MARVDSVRADTLHGATPDTTHKVVMPRPPADTGRKPGLFGPNTDLSLDFRTRLEMKAEKRTDDRCANGIFLGTNQVCSSDFVPQPDFQFTMRSNGTVADRVHVNVDLSLIHI